MLTPPPRRRFLLVTTALVLAVAAGLLVWSVVDLVAAGTNVDRARHNLAAANKRLADLRDDAATTKTARDQALATGGEAIAVLNTLDYHTVDADLDEWERITTGSLHEEIVSGREQTRSGITNARSVTKATILSSVVKEVDEQAGTATVLVALRVNISANDAAPTDKYLRLKGTLLRAGREWKLDSIGQVAYGS